MGLALESLEVRYIQKIAYHRNGSSGSSFHVVMFREGRRMMVATVFEGAGDVAILNRDLLVKGVIEKGENTHRAEEYEKWLRDTIATYGDNWPVARPKPG